MAPDVSSAHPQITVKWSDLNIITSMLGIMGNLVLNCLLHMETGFEATT